MSRALLFFPLLFALSTAVSAQCRMRITGAETCDASGRPYRPRLGDPLYRVQVHWTVSGTPKTYSIKFEVADQSFVKTGLTLGAGDHHWLKSFRMPLAGSIPYRIELDPDHASGNSEAEGQVVTGTFAPSLPASKVEYYDSSTLAASEEFDVHTDPGATAARVSCFLGEAPNQGSQRILHTRASVEWKSVRLQPEGAAAYIWRLSPAQFGKETRARIDYQAQLSSVRYDFTGGPSWSDFGALSADSSSFLKAGPFIQSGSPAVKSYVADVLGPDFKSKLNPVNAARALYCAIARDIEFKAPWGVDALETLTKRQGDSGGMSSLYVACLRSIGIPARMVGGWKAGNDTWHGWSELFLPGYGWIPQDVGDCAATSKSGKFAYDFDCIPDLNERFAVCKGEQFQVDTVLAASLQRGAYVVHGAKGRVEGDAHCSLGPG